MDTKHAVYQLVLNWSDNPLTDPRPSCFGIYKDEEGKYRNNCDICLSANNGKRYTLTYELTSKPVRIKDESKRDSWVFLKLGDTVWTMVPSLIVMLDEGLWLHAFIIVVDVPKDFALPEK